MKFFKKHEFIVSMVNIVLGIAIGTCLTVWYLVFNLSFPFNHDLTINFVIALATVFGVAIHFDSVRKQRKDRLWEINKEHLLELSKSLSDAIQLSMKYSQNEHLKLIGSEIVEKICDKNAENISLRFNQITLHFLTIYRPLIDNNLIKALEKYDNDEMEINCRYETDEEYTKFYRWDDTLKAQLELQEKLSFFIKKVSGL